MIIGLSEILKFTLNGIYFPKADFYIDPRKKVQNAIITHAHSDHARKGMESYIAHKDTAKLLKYFYGIKLQIKELEYQETIEINNVKITLYPAGHILGSSQVLLEYNGIKVVIAGDYKVVADNVSQPFETVKCDVFVTEATFAKTRYKWPDQDKVFNDINEWWKENKSKEKVSFISTYALGK